MVEGLDLSVESRYELLRGKYVLLRYPAFLEEYGPAWRVVELLERNLSNGNRERTRRGLAELGVKVDGLDDGAIISAYLYGLNRERLTRARLGPKRVNPKEQKFKIHYGSMAIMCREL